MNGTKHQPKTTIENDQFMANITDTGFFYSKCA